MMHLQSCPSYLATENEAQQQRDGELGVTEENNVQQVWISGLLQEQPEAGRYRDINSYNT